MKTLLKKLELALYYFENKELHQFDAQVGDTLCQIRAYKIYCLSTYSTSQLLEKIKILKINIPLCLNKLSIQTECYKGLLNIRKTQRPKSIRDLVTLTEFFDEIDCVIPFPDEILFLFTAHFLCYYHVVNDDNMPTAINFSAISNDLSLTKNFANKLIDFYQKKLSDLSCEFIFRLIEELPEFNDLGLILPLLHRQSNGRMVLPCYCVSEVIVLHMIEKEANLVLLIDTLTANKKNTMALFLKGSKKQQNFELINETQPDARPCMVMYGYNVSRNTHLVENILEKMLAKGIKEVLLSNTAAHPQYSGVGLSSYKDNPYAALISQQQNSLSIDEISIAQKRAAHLIRMKHFAQKIGCTQDNPTLFLLTHIFCNTFNAYKKFLTVTA